MFCLRPKDVVGRFFWEQSLTADIVFRQHVIIESFQFGSSQFLYRMLDGANEFFASEFRIGIVSFKMCHRGCIVCMINNQKYL